MLECSCSSLTYSLLSTKAKWFRIDLTRPANYTMLLLVLFFLVYAQHNFPFGIPTYICSTVVNTQESCVMIILCSFDIKEPTNSQVV